MRKLHFTAGLLTVVVFLITGQLMRRHTPPLGTLDASIRLMHRSRHIYILAAGLVNLMVGLYVQTAATSWRQRVQAFGSALLLISPALLIVAFTLEPVRGFQPEMWWSSAGLYALFGGSMAHLASALGVGSRKAAAQHASK
jgi:hypothetical protein